MSVEKKNRWLVLVHGGAGAMRSMGPKKEADYRRGLADAVLAGADCLRNGGQAIESAVAAVRSMELSGAFNAGHGSCLTADGLVEADAAVMNGADLSYGAVAAVPRLGNAVVLAETIRSKSPHCLFAGHRALQSIDALNGPEPEFIDPSPGRLRNYRQHLERIGQMDIKMDDLSQLGGTHNEGDTVGAVVLDHAGGLAAAVSTGGIWLKQPGRVGDSPIAGAGLWAENGLMACAATGTGEYIMRAALAADLRARVQQGASMEQAGKAAMAALRTRFGAGRAGLIGVDLNGRITTAFDTAGMGRAWLRAGDTTPVVRVWPEDDDA
ncbi:MAG: isoaspartyl peptidase/L-asparaginase [Myxococcota bacterium]|nr:isoaspartyl peptidase/L-asparaginase [Myxococcota bacterium]